MKTKIEKKKIVKYENEFHIELSTEEKNLLQNTYDLLTKINKIDAEASSCYYTRIDSIDIIQKISDIGYKILS